MTQGIAATASRRWLLALGALAVVLSAYRWGIAPLAWVAPVPLLLVQRHTHGWRDRLLLLAIVTVASIVGVAKIITAPLPLVLAIPFAVPSALSAWLLLIATETIRRRAGELSAVVAFVALTGLAEWASCVGSPLGMWGSGASTQIDNLLLLQFASIAGVPGVGMVMALGAAALAMWLGSDATIRHRVAAGAGAVIVGVLGWGALRLDNAAPVRTVRVAAVVIDAGPETSSDGNQRAASLRLALQRTSIAAQRGAQLIVWNEAAVFTVPSDEAALLNQVAALARANSVDIVAAYAVVQPTSPVMYDNKFVWVAADGEAVDTYRKHHPVPGEPSMRGDAPMRSHRHAWGVAGGAICYDFDFPTTAQTLAHLHADIVAAPSSDWRGIDPYHTQMARISAIMGGFAIVRPVRAATSAAFDAYGRTRATMSGYESNDRIMLATLPSAAVATYHAALGDTPLVLVCLTSLATIAVVGWRNRRRRIVTL
jgi:apolipoprotein N-acyltransferase